MKKSNNYIIPVLLILFLVFVFFTPIISYQSWFKWWNKYDPDKKYRCVPLYSLAFFNSSVIVYNIINLFQSESKKIEYKWWVYFITGLLQGSAIGIVPNGICTPKTICESLIPYSVPVNNYYQSVDDAQQGMPKAMWPTSTGIRNTNKKGEQITNQTRGFGWKGTIMSWGNITYDPSLPLAKQYNWDDNMWFDPSNTDNFLAKWGIPPNSGLIVAYITGLSKSPIDGEILYNGLEPLLGIKTGNSSGGWYGLLQLGDKFGDRGILEVNRLIWSEQPRDIAKQITQNQKPNCNGASIISGVIGTGMGGAFAGGAIGSAIAPGPGTVIGAVIGTIIGGATGGTLSAASQKCI